jgi:hypothetical protein
VSALTRQNRPLRQEDDLMKRRCPHCQTTPLRDDAETCWYCGKDYALKRRTRRVAHAVGPASLSRRRQEDKTTAITAR